MTSYTSASASKRGAASDSMGPLRALQLIESVGESAPYRIVPVMQQQGSAMSPNDRMAAKVRWAERATYAILSSDVPAAFAPYNTVIRVSERGTEDTQRDYLAHMVVETEGTE